MIGQPNHDMQTYFNVETKITYPKTTKANVEDIWFLPKDGCYFKEI